MENLPVDMAEWIGVGMNSALANLDPSVAMELVFIGGNYAPQTVEAVVRLLKTNHHVRGMDTLEIGRAHV